MRSGLSHGRVLLKDPIGPPDQELFPRSSETGLDIIDNESTIANTRFLPGSSLAPSFPEAKEGGDLLVPGI